MSRHALTALALLGSLCLTAFANDPAPAAPPADPKPAPTATPAPDAKPTEEAPKPKPPIVERLKSEGVNARYLVNTWAVQQLVDAIAVLPQPGERTCYRDRAKGVALSKAEYDALPEDKREGLEAKTYPPDFYYLTGYGTPLVYLRPLDLASRVPGTDFDSFVGRKVLDFGYGTIGHLRLLASCGAHVHGVEVEPLFRAYYSEKGDVGAIKGFGGLPDGSITLHTGRFPADEAITKAIKDAGPYDLFISKNTLKRGYIHPARECDPAKLIQLGVDDETFLKSVYEILKPGGIVMIYNICPPPAPESEPYIPWADGRCPFEKEMILKQGFEIMTYDEDDAETLHRYWQALGLHNGQTREELEQSIFVHYTLLRRPLVERATEQPVKE